ncbi:MAG TPA: carboxypeptidase-like regulatory domain-containing protein [Polyangiaceae bacterium]
MTARGFVSDESGTPIAGACLYLGDRRVDDPLDDLIAGADTKLACLRQTNDEGRFKITDVVAGDDNHDYWLVAWKEGFVTHSERVWKDDGFPGQSFDVSIVLASVE